MRTMTAGLLALALAGCGKTASGDGKGFAANRGTIDDVPTEAQADARIGGIVAVGTATPVPGVPVEAPPHPSEIRHQARSFPTAFQGKWGLTPADCDLSRTSDATGLMKIEADKVGFYQSTATVAAMPVKTPFVLVADLDFVGPEDRWHGREKFALQTGGIAIVLTDPDEPGAKGRTQRYERC